MHVRPDRTSVRAKATGGFTIAEPERPGRYGRPLFLHGNAMLLSKRVGAPCHDRAECTLSARFEVRLVQLWYDIHDGDGGSGYEGHAEMDITGLVAI
jgi:hypothetical protein